MKCFGATRFLTHHPLPLPLPLTITTCSLYAFPETRKNHPDFSPLPPSINNNQKNIKMQSVRFPINPATTTPTYTPLPPTPPYPQQ